MAPAPPPVERFAPSPTGLLHLGHAFSAMLAHDAARQAGGRFLLRIEDLDEGRARETFVDAIFRELGWLGLRWERPVMRQSARADAYSAALDRLAARGLLYPCVCTRADIAAAAAPQEGDAAAVYPGTCRGAAVDPSKPAALRLDLASAFAAAPPGLALDEIGAGPNGETGRLPLNPDALLRGLGDVVLARKDGFAAYHLAVVVDDAAQGVTCVTRGEDLFEAAPLHRLLQALLGLAPPVWRHHQLIRDGFGRRLAKRDDARSLASLREAGATPAGIRARLGLPAA
ncbi:tRNA glutamyl-Q(34) synthetase GluQRS [Rubrimonas cliftonensis]|uniref:Glutamyl-Q tRNA(Asp) synthetase n=1 Tax=Rubrimonas cliftonensis TaxID=89524 RepID=A0A1H3VUF8_9RHOB|nr:tRNA glutamyl-Q(34) synthetase GluQRS [Rubrimonas cliftonensis]SDZ77752.1 glutamyl-Q tRNA(Asp) synthetase [Rubrimonas cliftonensis]